MRIAICLSGHMRFYKRLKPNFDKFYFKLSKIGDVDIFISTWSKQNAIMGTSSGNKNYLSDYHTHIEINEEELNKIYKPKKVTIFDEDFYGSKHSPFVQDIITKFGNLPSDSQWSSNGIVHGYRQFFLMHQSNILKKKIEFETDSLYDLVFRVRPDFYFRLNYLNSINFDATPNTIYCGQETSGIDDQFFYGDSTTMDKVMSSFLRLSNYLVKYRSDSSTFHPLVFDSHPDIKLVKFEERIGVLPCDPIPEGVEYDNDVVERIKDIRWYR